MSTPKNQFTRYPPIHVIKGGDAVPLSPEDVGLDPDIAAGLANCTSFTTSWVSASLVTGVETTVFTYVVPALKEFCLERASYTGRADGLFRVKVNGTIIEYAQIVWTHRHVQSLFPFGTKLTAGQTLTVTAFNQGTTACDMYGAVTGRLQDP